MEKQTLHVEFMSGFELHYGQKPIGLAKEVSSKAQQLLAALLYYNRTGISRDKLITNLYQNEDLDAANSFKALTFRLRKKLIQSGLPDGDYIVIQDGLYRFGDAVAIEADTDLFLDAIAAASRSDDEKDRAAAYSRACEAYNGEFLPFCSDQSWVVFTNAELMDAYTNAARWLADYYNRRREYDGICALCKRVSFYYPFDEEWYIKRLTALIDLGKYRQAMDEYEAIASMLFDEMGVYPSEQLMDCARAVSNKVVFPFSSGDDVNDALRDTQSTGAYYCSYPGFADSYHVLKRIMDRDGVPSCLLLCTLTDDQNRPLEDKDKITSSIQLLRMALGSTLRKCDMYTRYSSAQMLVMLWGTGKSNVGIIIERINALLQSVKLPGSIRVAYTVLEGNTAPQFISSASAPIKKKGWRKMDVPVSDT